jgi:Zn-dependent protease
MIISLFRQGLSAQEIIYYLIIILFALTISFAFHEFMHAAVAVWLGDPTPRNMGRLTLNPLAHLDPMGTVLLLVAGFGWGKPVMYNPTNLHRFKSRRGMNIMVHLAGVTGNLFIAYIASILSLLFGGLCVRFPGMTNVFMALYEAFYYTYLFSMSLLAFNLLPIPPLDGFHVLEELLPYKFKASDGYRKFQRVAPMILMVLFLASSFGSIPILSLLLDYIKWPFEKLIDILSVPFYMLFQMIGL